jgi:hypothetical protein
VVSPTLLCRLFVPDLAKLLPTCESGLSKDLTETEQNKSPGNHAENHETMSKDPNDKSGNTSFKAESCILFRTQ